MLVVHYPIKQAIRAWKTGPSTQTVQTHTTTETGGGGVAGIDEEYYSIAASADEDYYTTAADAYDEAQPVAYASHC